MSETKSSGFPAAGPGAADGNRPPRAGGAIAVFVKTPGRSPVKTRFAATIGSAAARAWYERAALAVAEVAAAAARPYGATVYFAVAEDEAVGAAPWTALPCLAQGQGGLGARMGRVHETLVRRHGFAILLGADAPQIPRAALADALAWCAAADARQAIGPARDGGFWLYGGNRVTPPPTWDAVPYSCGDTAKRFRAAFAAAGPFRELPALTDVDHGADLVALRRELAALAQPTPAQAALAAWLAAGAVA